MIHRIKLLCYKVFYNSIKNNALSDEAKLIYVYRYLSWALTSFVYLTGRPYSFLFFKIGVIVSLFICSKIITDLYIMFQDNKRVLKTLALVETLGITVLLLPTGGLISPFIWYALNPTLVAASFLPAYFCWINLTFYLLAGSSMSYFLFNPSGINMTTLFLNNSNLILVFILMTLVVQLLVSLTKKLHIQKEALETANTQKQESIEHIMSLYHIIEAFNNHSTKERLFQALADYTSKLTKSDLSFFWLPNMIKDRDIIISDKNLNKLKREDILREISKLSLDWGQYNKIQEIKLADSVFWAIPILSHTNHFGLIAIQKKKYTHAEEIEQNIKLLQFLAGLSAVTLERFILEDMEDNFLVIEEQNRIANEIHDSVSQRLFSITYAIHGILGRCHNLSQDELKEYLTEMNMSSNLAMQELRDSIYRLSSNKKGEKSLQDTLKAYLDNISKLNRIIINLDVQGDESLLLLSIKKGLTRIIREACSNAIRHGKCQEINIELEIQKSSISLCIIDDGNGFELDRGNEEKQRGIGISNMKNLVIAFNGNLKINSEIGEGTVIDIIIPLSQGLIPTQQGGLAI